MEELFTEKQYKSAKSRDKLPCECSLCHKTFYIIKERVRYERKNAIGQNQFCGYACARLASRGRTNLQEVNCMICNKSFQKRKDQCLKYPKHFCSRVCADRGNVTQLTLKCTYCGKPFKRHASEAKRRNTEIHFCGRVCMGKYTRTHPRTYTPIRHLVPCKQCGKLVHKSKYSQQHFSASFCNRSCSATYRMIHNPPMPQYRSKLEKWLTTELLRLYPKLYISTNNRVTLGYELDIFIPGLQLAFEINGPGHYRPIYGEADFIKKVRNDARKKVLCINNGITLVVIDVSKQNYVTPKTSQVFLDEIVRHIELFIDK